ncbi:MAG TPA: hypothetical protein VNZ26_28925, partial [Vicinamibacterales bacterium]|nr:hypothetical protein [Vicinamibacterales bacterium]
MIRNLGRVAGVTSARLALALALVGWARPASAAVDDFLGRIVSSVHLTIEGRETSDPALSGVVRTP